MRLELRHRIRVGHVDGPVAHNAPTYTAPRRLSWPLCDSHRVWHLSRGARERAATVYCPDGPASHPRGAECCHLTYTP